MDVGVYELSEISNDEIKEKVKNKEDFTIKGVEFLKFFEAVNTLEKIIEGEGLRCRVYTTYRASVMGGMALSNPFTATAGLVAAAGIAAHNAVTFNPDYEIGKNLTLGTLEVTYKK